MPKWVWISAVAFLVVCVSCKQQPETGRIEIRIEQHQPDEPTAVAFGIRPIGKQTPDRWRYVASYTREGKVARFAIYLALNKTSSSNGGLRSGTGSFIADPKSENAVLLADLQQAFKASHMPMSDIRVRELPFHLDIVGENLDRGRNGGLIDAATGNWVSARLFLGPQQNSEVFLNFQKPGGTGEFLLKEPGYGNDILRELAKVL